MNEFDSLFYKVDTIYMRAKKLLEIPIDIKKYINLIISLKKKQRN